VSCACSTLLRSRHAAAQCGALVRNIGRRCSSSHATKCDVAIAGYAQPYGPEGCRASGRLVLARLRSPLQSGDLALPDCCGEVMASPCLLTLRGTMAMSASGMLCDVAEDPGWPAILWCLPSMLRRPQARPLRTFRHDGNLNSCLSTEGMFPEILIVSSIGRLNSTSLATCDRRLSHRVEVDSGTEEVHRFGNRVSRPASGHTNLTACGNMPHHR